MALNYIVKYGLTNTGPWTTFPGQTALTTEAITGLAAGTSYYFQVITVDTVTLIQGDPAVAGPFSTATGINESAEGTQVLTAGPIIYASPVTGQVAGATLDQWTLSGGVAILNGTATPSGNVTEIYYHNHTVYQWAPGFGWWFWDTTLTPDAWTGTTALPAINSVAISGTTFTSGAPTNTVVGAISVTMLDGSAFAGTLSLPAVGNNASFNISGNSLRTTGVLTGGPFSVSVKATVAANTITQAFTISTGVSGGVVPITPPAHLPTGWQIAFFDDFTTSTTITTGSASGFNWYANVPNNVWTVLTGTKAGAINNGNSNAGTNASTTGGIWQINGSVGNYNANWVTCPNNVAVNGVNGKPNYWSHNVYYEAYLQFTSVIPSNYGATGTAPQFPAFWSWSINSSPVACEIDFFENFFAFDGTVQPNNSNWSIFDPGGGGGAGGGGPMGGQGDSQWHTVGCLWQNTGTGQGQLSFFFDGVQQGGTVTTGAGRTVPDMENVTGQYISIGTGANWTLNVDWVRVWTPTG